MTIESYTEDLRHRYEINWLGPGVEPKLLASVLKVLDFDAAVEESPTGLSGISHPKLLVGRRSSRKHLVIVQSGFHRSFDTSRPRAERLGEPPPPAHDRRPLTEREEEVRRELLFASYDVKARFEKDGWTCDIIYFMNMSSPDDIGKSFSTELKRRYGGQLGGVDLRSTIYSSNGAIARIPPQALRQNALATGACFLSLGDFLEEELVAIATASEDEALSATRSSLARTRVLHYFAPPADELMLATLAEARVDWSERDLVVVPHASKHFKHPVAPTTVLTGVNKDDPLEVALALRGAKFINYEGEKSYVTDDGYKIVHKISTTPQESWSKKIATAVELLKSLKELIPW